MTVSSTPLPRQSRPLSRFSLFLVFFVGVCSGTLAAAEPAEGQKLLLTGDYAGAIKLAQTALDAGAPNEEWSLVLGKSLLTVGRLADAEDAVAKALSRQSTSIRLRWLGREISLASGRPEQATKIVESIFQLYSERYWAYRSPPDLVVFGRVALIKGADPKDVLDKVFAVAQKTAPTLRDVYLARGDLALEKHDYALAATVFQDGLKGQPDDPDLNYGLARAHAEGDRKVMLDAMETALKTNPRHIPSLLMFADHRIDEENYEEAAKLLDSVVAINSTQPDAWALRSVLAHLRNDPETEKASRSTA